MALRPGVHSVAVTPFARDESLDVESWHPLVDRYAVAGCAGILVLGVLGEAERLSDDERRRVLDCALREADGRLQVTVGITHGSTRVTSERARAAQLAGADAVMVAPPTGLAAGPALRDHFRRVADGLGIPLVVQDYPAASGVKLPVEFLAALADDLPPGSGIKLEDPPSPAKMARVREAAPGLQLLGGLGGVALLQELDAGADGTMTGFALPELLVGIVEAHRAGDAEAARRTFERALPLLVFEFQPVVGLALRKEILRRRGAIACAQLRSPAGALDERTLAELDVLLDAAEARA